MSGRRWVLVLLRAAIGLLCLRGSRAANCDAPGSVTAGYFCVSGAEVLCTQGNQCAGGTQLTQGALSCCFLHRGLSERSQWASARHLSPRLLLLLAVAWMMACWFVRTPHRGSVVTRAPHTPMQSPATPLLRRPAATAQRVPARRAAPALRASRARAAYLTAVRERMTVVTHCVVITARHRCYQLFFSFLL
jgi:hypothetical protein